METAKHGHEQCLAQLLASKADVNKSDDKGFSALMHAAEVKC